MLPVTGPRLPNSNILVSPLAAVTATSALPDRGTANGKGRAGTADGPGRDEATHDRAVGNLKVCCLLLVGADFVGPRPRAHSKLNLKLAVGEPWGRTQMKGPSRSCRS